MDGPKVIDGGIWEALSYTVTSVPAGRQVVVDGSDVHDAAGVQLAAGNEPYDRGDVASDGCGGDADTCIRAGAIRGLRVIR